MPLLMWRGFSTGYSLLAGGIVLAIMVFPIIIHVSCEVISSLPYELREASLALGATKWQTVKHVVLRKAMPGIIAAIVLGLSRAFGEPRAHAGYGCGECFSQSASFSA